MTRRIRSRYLVVVRGADKGARLALTDEVKLVGRSRDAQLILSDRSVSRRHFHIEATKTGAYIHTCSDVAPFLLEGREETEAHVRVGATLVVGDTVFQIAEDDNADAPPESAGGATTIGSLLTGAAADVRGLAAIFALNEALLTASDIAAIEATLASWAKAYASCERIELAATGPAPESSANEKPIFEMATSDGGVRIVVPAHGAPKGWIAFETKLPPARVTDSLRRLLAVAAGLCASRLVQLLWLVTVKEESESFRQQAMGSAHAFLGTSPAAKELARTIPKLAASELTVLLMGETGVGKGFVARLIHELGQRRNQPFQIINCASIPENLIESELFGHERGAFTGANRLHIGAFERARGGTLFLDEIGELPLASQSKLLHVLSDKQYERLGSVRSIALEARIIAATNRDLNAMVAAGAFRKDLFFRLWVLRAVVPPLRERDEDRVLLAKQILADLSPTAGRRVEGFSLEALDAIQRYDWPGNVREMRNAIEHAVVMGEGAQISAADLSLAGRVEVTHASNPPNALSNGASGPDLLSVRLPANLEWLEQRAVAAALQETGGNQTKAAALLGISRNTLAKKMREGTG